MNSLIRAEVSAAALRDNLQRVREVAPSSRVMAVVKANAYGHGLVTTALCLADADAFAVARLQEALVLRGAGVRKPIVLLEGVFDAEQLAEAARHDLQIVVHTDEQLALLGGGPVAASFIVWLKIDTGMNRLGFRVEQAASALLRLASLGPRVRELRLLSHFANADEADSAMTGLQLARFNELSAGRGWTRSLCNSAGLFSQPAGQVEWVRPGLALYGVSPFPELLGTQLGLRPAMRLVSTVIAVREVRAGETVGYGGAWRALRDARVAIVAAGYGDGLPRSLENGTPVLVNGRRAALVGRVSMDMVAVDVTAIPGVRVGDPAILWGPELPVEQIAAHAGTIPYELLCGVSQRVPLALG
ncbi:MAG TPA: alanine racemase [Steroidobacteraceae bacterium]|nr:alanine racemase [Steroidobacteraceae bacterium]